MGNDTSIAQSFASLSPSISTNEFEIMQLFHKRGRAGSNAQQMTPPSSSLVQSYNHTPFVHSHNEQNDSHKEPSQQQQQQQKQQQQKQQQMESTPSITDVSHDVYTEASLPLRLKDKSADSSQSKQDADMTPSMSELQQYRMKKNVPSHMLHSAMLSRRTSESGISKKHKTVNQHSQHIISQQQQYNFIKAKQEANNHAEKIKNNDEIMVSRPQTSSKMKLTPSEQSLHNNHLSVDFHPAQIQQKLLNEYEVDIETEVEDEGEVLHISFKSNPISGVVRSIKWKHIPNRLRNMIVDLEDELFLTKREVESLKIYYLNVERDEHVEVKHDLDLVVIRQFCKKYKAVQIFVEIDMPRTRSGSLGNIYGPCDNDPKYRKIREIGRGAFGVVNLIIDQRGIPIAEKKIRITDGKKYKLQKIENEVKMLESLDHPHIVQYYGTRRCEKYLYILMEYVPCGSIGGLLRKMHRFDEELISNYLRQTLIGLQYLHSKYVIHRDIKPDNLLLTSIGEIKLADFGCSTIAEMHKKMTSASTADTPPSPSLEGSPLSAGNNQRYIEIFGTPAFMSPEIVSRNEYAYACDVWAVGCMGIMLYTGEVPWSKLTKEKGFYSPEQLMLYIGEGNSPPLPENISSEFQSFLSQCLEINPEDRATVTTLIRHPFITGAHFKRRQSIYFDQNDAIDEEDEDVNSCGTYIHGTSANNQYTAGATQTSYNTAFSENQPNEPHLSTFVENNIRYAEPMEQRVLYATNDFENARIERDFELIQELSVKCDLIHFKPTGNTATLHRYLLQNIISSNVEKYVEFVKKSAQIKQIASVNCIIESDTELFILQEVVDLSFVDYMKDKFDWIAPITCLSEAIKQLHQIGYLMVFASMKDFMYSQQEQCFKVKNVGMQKILFSHTFFIQNINEYNYAAPEVINLESITEKADMWLIGFQLLQLLTRKGFDIDFFMDQQFLNQEIEKEISNEYLRHVLYSLLNPNPEKRANFEEIREYLKQQNIVLCL